MAKERLWKLTFFSFLLTVRAFSNPSRGFVSRAWFVTVGAGSEALKNLVLPGVGQFTIVDPHAVQESDLYENFFVDRLSLGRSRAQVCSIDRLFISAFILKNMMLYQVVAEYLCEMNPDVSGRGIALSIEELLTQGSSSPSIHSSTAASLLSYCLL